MNDTPIAASFFTGIGGLDLAAERAGFTVKYMCEIDPYCRAVLRRHWKGIPIFKDIRNVSKANFTEQPDLIFGGFPCTDISVGTGNNGKGLEGQQSGLWFELARIIGEVRPRLIVLENVPAITFRGGATVTAQLAQMGYDTFWFTIRVASVGSPQYRERWFLLGYTNSIGRQSTAISSVYQARFRTDSQRQQIQECHAPEPTRQGGRKRSRAQYLRQRSQSSVGRKSDGLSSQVDILAHEFPAGSWQPQKAHEPYRLSPDTSTRKYQIKVLGNAVVPQQAYPIFAAAYEFLCTVT